MPNHNHSELNAFINAIAAVPVGKRESDQYFSIVNAVLDIYLGKVPETFTYKGVGYTPKSFAASLQINPDDYIEISSFTLFPFYSQGVVPFLTACGPEKVFLIDAEYVKQMVASVVRDQDLSRYIL